MIRIARGPEPQEVADAREEHLAHALLAADPDGPGEITGYGVARAHLYTTKCAYCEAWVQEESQPVEHFRPRGRPSRVDWSTLLPPLRASPGAGIDEARFARGLPPLGFERVRWPDPARQVPPEPGYWWLAWTWENLVFGCQSCNGASRKGTRFPLARGSRPLGLREQPPGTEQPLLLDPADPNVDPMDVIRFRWDGKHWRPFAVDDHPRAAWTIAVLGLDGPSLLSLYASRVVELWQMARAFRNKIAEEASFVAIRSEWSRLHDAALAPGASFLALAHDWLLQTFADEMRRFDLPLRRPVLAHPAIGPVSQRPPLPPRPELDGLSEPLQHRARWLRHFQARTEELYAFLIDLCSERPSTLDELVQMIGRPTALPQRLRDLEGHALVCDPITGRWRPP